HPGEVERRRTRRHPGHFRDGRDAGCRGCTGFAWCLGRDSCAAARAECRWCEAERPGAAQRAPCPFFVAVLHAPHVPTWPRATEEAAGPLVVRLPDRAGT